MGQVLYQNMATWPTARLVNSEFDHVVCPLSRGRLSLSRRFSFSVSLSLARDTQNDVQRSVFSVGPLPAAGEFDSSDTPRYSAILCFSSQLLRPPSRFLRATTHAEHLSIRTVRARYIVRGRAGPVKTAKPCDESRTNRGTRGGPRGKREI